MGFYKYTAAVFITGLITACGAGSGGGADVTINSDSAPDVGKAVIDSITSSVGSYGTASSYSGGYSVGTGVVKEGGESRYTVGKQLEQIYALFAAQQAKESGLNSATSTGSTPFTCDTGTGSLNWTDNTVGSNIDYSFSLSYNQCVQFGYTSNGSISGTVTGTSGSTTISLTYGDFISSGSYAGTAYSNSISGSVTSATVGSVTTVTMPSFVVSGTWGSQSYTSTISNYVTTLTDETTQYKLNISGTVSNTQMGGAVTIATISDIYILKGALYPYQGVMQITSGGTTATITYGSGGTYTVTVSGTTYNCSYTTQTCS